LRTSHQVTTTHDYWNGVFLHRSRDSVSGEFDVGEQMVVERWVGESEDRFRDIVPGSFNGDVVVVGKIDTSVALVRVAGDAEEFTLGLEVLGTWNMLSITPLSVARATRGSRTTTSCRITVGVWIERSSRTLRWPSVANRSVAARLEVRCASPFAAVAIHRALKTSVNVRLEHS
jgi:hypothetical protein